MALSTAADYQTLALKLLFYIDNVMSGIDRYGLPVFAKIEPEDFASIMTAYETLNYDAGGLQQQTTGYKIGREARPVKSELYPNSHGSNEATFTNGGVPVHTQAEPTQTPPAYPIF